MTDLTRNKIDYLFYHITKWYENAKRDYGVVGNVTDISYSKEDRGTIIVLFGECGEKYQCTIVYVCDFTAQQLYDIWMQFLMEQA